MNTIKFGTDGWRAVMCDTFTFSNVRVVARAVAEYLKSEGLAERGVVIGYDTRFLGDRFAKEAAQVMSESGVPVLLTETDAPTPVVAYSIIARKTAGALMFTASHNPPEYQGVKFIPEYAGPASPEITAQIEANIKSILDGATGAHASTGATASPSVSASSHASNSTTAGSATASATTGAAAITTFDPKPEYLEHIKGLVDLAKIAKAGLRVVFDPMYGTGRQYLPDLLNAAGCRFEMIHGQKDPLFGGTTPEPLADHLVEMRDRLKAGTADLGLATDGDADRFGIVDSDGEYVSPNQIISLLLAHLVRKGRTGNVARTVATTHLIDRLAAHYGLSVKETPVGFKYICQAMREGPIVIGGEESGGLSIGTHIPEKDGILACLLVAEMRAETGKSLHTLLGELMQEVGSSFSKRIDIHYEDHQKKAVIEGLKGKPPVRVGGHPVDQVLSIDGVKVILTDGSWFLVRASGTEPLVRVYVEAGTSAELEQRIEDVKSVLSQYLGEQAENNRGSMCLSQR